MATGKTATNSELLERLSAATEISRDRETVAIGDW
jgi:hypothetical protein